MVDSRGCWIPKTTSLSYGSRNKKRIISLDGVDGFFGVIVFGNTPLNKVQFIVIDADDLCSDVDFCFSFLITLPKGV